jgi:hypothetical protein
VACSKVESWALLVMLATKLTYKYFQLDEDSNVEMKNVGPRFSLSFVDCGPQIEFKA